MKMGAYFVFTGSPSQKMEILRDRTWRIILKLCTATLQRPENNTNSSFLAKHTTRKNPQPLTSTRAF